MAQIMNISFLKMCLRVLKGIQRHLKRLDLFKSQYPIDHALPAGVNHRRILGMR